VPPVVVTVDAVGVDGPLIKVAKGLETKLSTKFANLSKEPPSTKEANISFALANDLLNFSVADYSDFLK